MSAGVFCHSPRHVPKAVTMLFHPATEVHVVKPEREKSFVKTTHFPPNLPPHHQKRTRRLLHFARPVVIQIQTAIPAIHRVVTPDPVEQESFQNQNRGRRKLP